MSQINTNWSQTETPSFIQNKWAECLGSRGADPIRVGTRISNNFMYVKQKIGGKMNEVQK
jgi:hypothetical protein